MLKLMIRLIMAAIYLRLSQEDGDHFCFRQERKQQYLDPTGFDTSLSSETGRTYSTKQSFAMTVIPELILTDRALLI